MNQEDYANYAFAFAYAGREQLREMIGDSKAQIDKLQAVLDFADNIIWIHEGYMVYYAPYSKNQSRIIAVDSNGRSCAGNIKIHYDSLIFCGGEFGGFEDPHWDIEATKEYVNLCDGLEPAKEDILNWFIHGIVPDGATNAT